MSLSQIRNLGDESIPWHGVAFVENVILPIASLLLPHCVMNLLESQFVQYLNRVREPTSFEIVMLELLMVSSFQCSAARCCWKRSHIPDTSSLIAGGGMAFNSSTDYGAV